MLGAYFTECEHEAYQVYDECPNDDTNEVDEAFKLIFYELDRYIYNDPQRG